MRLRERANTTPGRLTLVAVLVVTGALCFGVIATAAVRSRSRATNAVRTATEPLLVQAAKLYTSLSDANATATTTFLTGGLEPAARRARYLADIRSAGDALTTLTHDVGGSPAARGAVATVAQQLPSYTGLVEAARANNRQGFPVGAAYLRKASGLLSTTILPEAGRLYGTEAERLSTNYTTGSSDGALIVLIVVAVIALLLLASAQLYIARVSRRVFNLPMLGATIVLAAASIWAVLGLIGEQDALARARRASDSVMVLSAARVLSSRAQSDQSLTLVNRGSDQTDPADFLAVMHTLQPEGGLLGEISALARRDGTTAQAGEVSAGFRAYQADTAKIAALEAKGRMLDAIGHASSAGSIAASARLNAALDERIGAEQARFTSAAADASSSVSGLVLAIPLLTLAAAALALFGIRQRLGEYR